MWRERQPLRFSVKMDYLFAIILILLNGLWLFTVILGLPGTWLMIISALLLAWSPYGHDMFSLGVLIAVAVVAVIGEVLEFITGVYGAKKAGGKKRGALGALIGGFIGGIIGTVIVPVPVIGSLIGACVGAALGAWGLEMTGGRDMQSSVRSGVGAGVGRLAGTVLKLACGLIIYITLAVAAFWP